LEAFVGSNGTHKNVEARIDTHKGHSSHSTPAMEWKAFNVDQQEAKKKFKLRACVRSDEDSKPLIQDT
jgi:hypothetical protein